MVVPGALSVCRNTPVDRQNMESYLYSLVRGYDTTGTTRGRLDLFLSVLRGLVTSTDSEPERGRYSIVVEKPLRVCLCHVGVGPVSHVEEFVYIHVPGATATGELHEVACRLVVSLSNPSWRLVQEQGADLGVCVRPGEGDCTFSIGLEDAQSLKQLTVTEGNLQLMRLRLAGMLGYARDAWRMP